MYFFCNEDVVKDNLVKILLINEALDMFWLLVIKKKTRIFFSLGAHYFNLHTYSIASKLRNVAAIRKLVAL